MAMPREVITSLEMTSPEELRPGRDAPNPINLVEVQAAAPQLLRTTYCRVWEALASGGRLKWSDTDWEHELSQSRVRAWLAEVEGEIAGLVELEVETTGDVGIVVFGLVPEFRGRGFGAAFLTLVTRLVWRMPEADPVRRVWLQTSSGDHPNAIRNYEARGFRSFRTQPGHD
jgi:ribosomal protein S18 acetylase RimI-like enzyme